MFQSGTCPNTNTDGDLAGVTGIAVGTGLSVDFDGCFARLNSSMLLSHTGNCEIEVTDDDTYNHYTHLIFRSGIRSTQRPSEPMTTTDCHYYIDANQFISNTGVCGREPDEDSPSMKKDKSKNHFDNLILGTGLVASPAKRTTGGGGGPSTDTPIGCAFRIDSAMKILSQDFCGSTAVSETNYEKLNFSGLHVEDQGDCQYLIKHEQNLKTDTDCTAQNDGEQDSLNWTNDFQEATPFKNLIFGRGIRVQKDQSSDSGPCDYKITAGMRIKSTVETCSQTQDQTGGYRTYVNLQIGSGFVTSRPDNDDCTLRLDTLTMGAAGCNIVGQTLNCGGNQLPQYTSIGTCDPGLDGCDITTPYDKRSVPDVINAFISGPGIGFASPQEPGSTDNICGGLTIFNNHIDYGRKIGNGCDDAQIYVAQVYQHNWGADFAINGLGSPVDTADATAITQIEISDASENWSMCVVTGIETDTTTIDGQTVVTAVYPLTTTVAGMKTCGGKYLITSIDPFPGAGCIPGPQPPPDLGR